MMNPNHTNSFSKLLRKAERHQGLRKRLLETKKAKDPLLAVSRIAGEEGCAVTVGDIFCQGEEFADELWKGSEGGGEDPMPTWDDGYGQFIAALQQMEYK